MGIEGKLLVSRKNIVVNKESIGIDNVLTKDRNMNTFKMYCKRRKSGAKFPDRKANNRLCACHCILLAMFLPVDDPTCPLRILLDVQISASGVSHSATTRILFDGSGK